MANEKRLIDANALVEQMHAEVDKYGEDYLFIDIAVDAVENAPTVDAVPVVHGRWEERYKPNGEYVAWDGYYCSVCGKQAAKSNYCPNCGAKMDGGNEDADSD